MGQDSFDSSVDYLVCPVTRALKSFKPGVSDYDDLLVSHFPRELVRAVAITLASAAAAVITSILKEIRLLILVSVQINGETVCYCLMPGSQGDPSKSSITVTSTCGRALCIGTSWLCSKVVPAAGCRPLRKAGGIDFQGCRGDLVVDCYAALSLPCSRSG